MVLLEILGFAEIHIKKGNLLSGKQRIFSDRREIKNKCWKSE